ncbi:MAG: hypothetical protein K0S01_2383 [Herbinix sp.]|jgi:glycosyltransferase involved in cell wall biosynthesis|nr:hypothetical protein [Herbinix sp.]
MNIVFVTRSMLSGGAERIIAELTKYMVKKSIECKIITLDKEKVFYHLPEQVEIHAIGEMSPNRYLDKWIRYKELRRYVKQLKPDLVLSLPEDIGIFVIPALLGTKIPVVVSERNNPWDMPWKKGTRLMRRLFYPFASGFIFQTEQAASFFSTRVRKRGIVLPNPLDLERVGKPWEGARRKEIVGAGRLEQQKNFPLLIKAFARFYESHPDYSLCIYGEGSLREELNNLAMSLLPPETYHLPGRTTELLEHMRGAAMFVLSSDYEGMPNVVIEAMAMGMPVISTDCPSGGSAFLIDNEKNGLLVPVGDEVALSKAMDRVAQSNEFAVEIGKNAQQIKHKLDSEVVAEKWREYLHAVSKR